MKEEVGDIWNVRGTWTIHHCWFWRQGKRLWAKEFKRPLETGDSLQFTSSKEMESEFYNHKELNPASNLNKQRNRYFFRTCGKEHSPADTLIFSLVRPMLDLLNYKIINQCSEKKKWRSCCGVGHYTVIGRQPRPRWRVLLTRQKTEWKWPSKWS